MKLRCLVAAIVGITLPALAQSQQPQRQPGWVTDSRNGCQVWNFYPQPNEVVSWSGKCLNGIASGPGVLQWSHDGKPGSRFEGDLRDGKPNGRGVYIWTNGDRFVGDLRDGKANGQGTLKKPDGSVFTGLWTNGCFQQGERWAAVGATIEECGIK